MNKSANTRFAAVIFVLFSNVVGHAQQGVHTPKLGSSERHAIMDAVRFDFYLDATAAHRNPKKLFCEVLFLKVHGDWALTFVNPVNASGKQFAEPRWNLLHRKSGQWTDVDYGAAIMNYESAHPDGPQTGEFDFLDMSALAIRKLWRAMPEVPKDIFPDTNKQHP